MLRHDLLVGDLPPLGRPDHVLRCHQRIAQEQRITHHLDEFVGWQIRKLGIVDVGVVDLVSSPHKRGCIFRTIFVARKKGVLDGYEGVN